jgi:glycosyltransferase involved in cell wall biosynthesis
MVVKEPRPGYGSACLRGIASLSEQSRIVVILDADHSDYPGDLTTILEPIIRGDADFVIGSRVAGQAERGSLHWNQRFGNALACSLIRWLYGRHCSDMGPFRAIRRESLKLLGMQDETYGWNAEMQVKAIIRDLTVAEVPVRYRKRIGRSKISGTIKGTILAGVKIIGTILRYYPEYVRSRRV